MPLPHATIGIMATLLLVLVVVLVIAGLVYGVISLLAGDDPGLVPAEPDGRARPLPNDRSLHEGDLQEVRFDVGLRGYRMGQVDRVLRRTAYDLGYKDEMIAVLEAEVTALREGRVEDADALRLVREEAGRPTAQPPAVPEDDEDEQVELDESDVVDFAVDPAEPAEDKADDPEAGDAEPEPREGSLLRRDPRPEATAILTVAGDGGRGKGGLGTTDVADRPRHA